MKLRIEEQGMTYIADMDTDNPLASLQAASRTDRIALGGLSQNTAHMDPFPAI